MRCLKGGWLVGTLLADLIFMPHRRYSREEWWHDDANVQKFKGVQGKTGTYLLRLTDWSTNRILDAAAPNDSLGRRVHSFCGRTDFQEASALTWRKFKSRSEVYPISSVQDLKKKLKTDKNFEQKWKLLFSDDASHDQQNNLQYTSATLKQRRRENREIGRMPLPHEFMWSNEGRKSRRQKIPSCKTASHSKKHQSSLKRTETHARQLDPDESESPKTKAEDNGTCRQREPGIRKHDYYNYLPEAAFLNRNDYHTRLSLRGTRVFGRRKSSRAFPNHERHIREEGSISNVLKCKSASLPSDLHQPENHDYEFWSAGFVQSRVRRLEEDLATKWEDKYNTWNCDFEVQSLCSLDFGRIVPDSDDYRIAYLSSMGTSLESSLDYMEDSISAFGMGTLDFRVDKQIAKEDHQDGFGNGMGTLDVRLTKKRAMFKNEDWDLSFSSTENRELSSDEDDEFDFSRISSINKSNHSLTFNSNNFDNTISNETEGNDFDDNTISEETEITSTESSKTVGCSEMKFTSNNFNSEGQIGKLNKLEATENEECTNKFEGECSDLNTPVKNIEDFSSSNLQNETSEDINCVQSSRKYTVPPKIWYEIRDPLDSKKTCDSDSNDLNQKYFKISTWHKRIPKTPPKCRSFSFTKNISCDEILHSTHIEIHELFNYEPLTTPFAEIYAIDCGKYPFKTASDATEESTQKTNIPPTDNDSPDENDQLKHEIHLQRQSNSCSDVSDPECCASGTPSKTIKFNEIDFNRSDSTVIIFGKDDNGTDKEGRNQNSFNLNPPTEKKINSLLGNDCCKPELLEINKIYIDSLLMREIDCFPLKDATLKFLSDICRRPLNVENAHNCHLHQKVSPDNKMHLSQSIQTGRADFHISEFSPPDINKTPFYSFFPAEEYLKRALCEFMNSDSNSDGFKYLIQAFINCLRRVTVNETPITSGGNPQKPLNQNYATQSNLRIETEVVNRVMSAGEITTESGSASCVTSQTGRAAFVEYPFPFHSECTKVSECNLPCGSVLHVTVPAVQRLAKRESCSPSQWAAVVTLRSTTTDGADQDTTTRDGCERDATCEIRIQNASNHYIILDYAIDTSAWRLDYNYGDYARFGCVPERLALLIVGDLCDGARVDGTGFRRIMATCDDDPRSLGRVVRTQGKNISKLMRFFDSNERTVSYTNESANPSPKSDDSRTKSSYISSSQSITEQQCANNHSNPVSEKCVQNGSSVNGSVMKDSQSSPAIAKASEVNGNAMSSERSCNGGNLTSDVPYCRKVSNGGLWENVNITAKSDSDGLWNSAQDHNQSNDLEQVSNSMVASTTELNNLIATSRAELSKKKEPSMSGKSNLESYFTSFENSRPGNFEPSSPSEKPFVAKDGSQYNNNEFFHPYLSSHFNCDMTEINFDDEEAMLSDTSSEEDLRSHPAMTNTNYLPAYALHTIIEESCEESERDSRTTTPTNDAVASKLERYFSWDIINDADAELRKKADDESTIYSDSLSESSNSLAGDDVKDIDPTHLASSRLEKYFTSGLVDDQNYFYPDDAEFLDDAPVSDFEEDSIHQKISRSALLSSLETKPIVSHQVDVCSKSLELSNTESTAELHSSQNESPVESSKNDVNSKTSLDSECDNLVVNSVSVANPPENTESLEESAEIPQRVIVFESSEQSCPVEVTVSKLDGPCEKADDLEGTFENDSHAHTKESSVKDTEELLNCSIAKDIVDESPKPAVNKEQLAVDIQAIIKKLLSYFKTEPRSESFKNNVETDYVSAWHILETEIERLLQSISPNAIENNSCNSSTIDSNNSDYGSDTIESMDCITDDDDVDAKSRINAKCPIVDILHSAYKYQSPESEFSSFNISDETLSIWKRLIQSLQKDNSVLSENKLCDPNAEARLYIRDQIVTLMHTITLNDSVQDIEKLPSLYQSENKEISQSLIEEIEYPDQINEAFNVNLGNTSILTHLTESDASGEVPAVNKTESSDESVSDGSREHVNILPEIPVTVQTDCLQHKDEPSRDLVVELVDGDISEDPSETSCEPPQPVNDLEKSSDDSISDSQSEKETIETNTKSKNKHIFPSREAPKKDGDLKFSVFVDIEFSDDANSFTDYNLSEITENVTCEPPEKFQTVNVTTQNCETSSSPINETDSGTDNSTPPLSVKTKNSNVPGKPPSSGTSRDTGYFSFKSSDDSLLNTSSQSAEFVDVPNFKSLKRTVKKFPMSSTLSKSTNNILQTFSSSPDAKFSTLQLKSKKPKSSSNTTSSPRQFTSLFSPSAVLKRFTSSKNSETPNPESSIPPKYLKKYARSISVDNDSLFGAISMPQLNSPKPGDSYSALGLYSENDRDSSLTLDDEAEVKRYFSGSQSALSLGAHSASMNSVYSAAGCHYGFVTVSGDVLFGLNYNQKSQMMEVFVKQCRNLAAIDVRHNKSNPYVKVYLLPDKTRSGKRKTKTKKNTVNPVFNELLRFPVLKNELESRTLWLSVWNSDLFGRNDFLGEISLPLGYRLLDSPTLRWYPLQERVESLQSPLQCKGELFIALKYVPRDLSLESRFRPAHVISLRGALHVLVKEARNISTQRSTLDAFCKSYLLPDKSKGAKQKTPIVKKSGHPKWYYTVIYEDLSVEELRERSLELTVWDHDKISRNHFVGGVRLNIGTGLYHGVPVDWMDARRDESGLWLSMLDSPNMWVDGCLPLRPTMHTQGTGLYS